MPRSWPLLKLAGVGVTFRREIAPALRVLAFPFAGGSPAWLRPLALALPPGVELSAMPLRFEDQRAFSTMAEVVSAVMPSLALDRPYVLYGHSIGAWVAYEVCRALALRGLPPPRALVVSGRQSPDVPHRLPPIAALPDAAFLAEVIARHDAIPQAVLESKELLAFVLPGLRADLAVGERYAHAPEPRLDLPLHVYGGRDDALVTPDDLEGWRRVSDGPCTVEVLPGGHFFVLDPPVQSRLAARLASYAP